MTEQVMVVQETPERAGAPRLRRELGLPGVLMQSMGTIAPAVGMILGLQFVVGYAGAATPLALVIAVCLMLTAAVPLSDLARRMPSAGGYYTFLSRTLHPRAGFLTAWLYFFYIPLSNAYNLGYASYVISVTLKAEYGTNIPWWIFYVAGTSLVCFVLYRGIAVSGKALLIFGLAELSILFTLGLFGFANPGAGGISLAVFSPGTALSVNGLYLGVVFSIFVFGGWESAAPLAEETADPRRTIPRALIGSILVVGLFFIITAWGLLTGWGIHRAAGFAASSTYPALALAHKYWGGAWIVVVIALANSALAVSLACAQAGTRMFYAMARSGVLPRALAAVHGTRGTPENAVKLEILLIGPLGFALALAMGPVNLFGFFGLGSTVAVVCVYVAGNIGVVRYFLKEARADLNVVRHIIFPVGSSLLFFWVLYKSLIPYPSGVPAWGPPVVGIWMLLAVGILVKKGRKSEDEWMHAAGEVLEGDESGVA